MSGKVATLAKPVLRGHLNKNIAKSLVIAVVLSAAAGLGMKMIVADPKKKKYAEFYKNYDPMVDFRRQRDLGLLQSAAPGDPE